MLIMSDLFYLTFWSQDTAIFLQMTHNYLSSWQNSTPICLKIPLYTMFNKGGCVKMQPKTPVHATASDLSQVVISLRSLLVCFQSYKQNRSVPASAFPQKQRTPRCFKEPQEWFIFIVNGTMGQGEGTATHPGNIQVP